MVTAIGKGFLAELITKRLTQTSVLVSIPYSRPTTTVAYCSALRSTGNCSESVNGTT